MAIQVIKTRMAPSPTGELHIGGLRTLLYNYAFAKKNNGKFVLRIEDTDKERFVKGATERIYQTIKDYGLSWDEGPFIQSERLSIYKKYAEELIQKEAAYYCFCSKERLNSLREEQRNSKAPVTKYDKKCLSLSKLEIEENLNNKIPYTIRLNVPKNRILSYEDLIHGKVSIPSNDIDDQVLLKSDGFPTYQFTLVVDDHLMEITHIIRGAEWLPSTPKHLLIYEALGWTMPKTGHLPNLKEIGANAKMSKRVGDVAAADFLKAGFLPEAVLNFIMLLGWNPGNEKEVFSLKEYILEFSLEKIHKTDLVAFDREKLLWMNGVYIRNLTDEALLEKVDNWNNLYGNSKFKNQMSKVNSNSKLQILKLVKDKMKLLSEFEELTSYFFGDVLTPVNEIKKLILEESRLSKNETKNELKLITSNLKLLTKWEKHSIDETLHRLQEQLSVKPRQLFMPLRIAITGSTISPPVADTMEVLGKDKTLKRLNKVINNL